MAKLSEFIINIFYFLLIFTATAQAEIIPTLMLDHGAHKGIIRDVIFTKDGKYLISSSDDKTVRVWNVKKGRLSRTVFWDQSKGAQGSVYAIALTKDNKYLAVGGRMPLIYIYNFSSGKVTALLKGHTRPVVSALSFSPDGHYLASAGIDLDIRIWDVNTLSNSKISKISKGPKKILKGHTNLIYSLSWMPDSNRLVSASDDKSIIVWDIKQGQRIVKLLGHSDKVRSVTVSPNGQYIASGSRDRTIRLWDGKTLNFIKVLSSQETWVPSISFFPNGDKLLSGSNMSIEPWNLNIISVPSGKKELTFNEHDNIVLATGISPDGKLAATGGGDDNLIYLWDTTNGKIKHTLKSKGRCVLSVGITNDANSIAWGNDFIQNQKNYQLSTPLQYCLNLNEKHIKLVSTGKVKNHNIFNRELKNHNNYNIDLKEADIYGNYRILMIKKNNKIIGSIERNKFNGYNHISSTLTYDNKYVISGGANGFLGLFRTDGTKVHDLIGHTGNVNSLAVSKNRGYLVSGSDDQTIRIWNYKTGENILSFYFVSDSEWVLWTPSGYYHSIYGAQYIGWQVILDNIATPEFYSLLMLKSVFNKPNVVLATFKYSSEKEALKSLGIKNISLNDIIDTLK